MIDRDHKLPLARQAKAVGISRGSIYYRPRPVGEAGLGLMRRIDELHLEYPFAGSRMTRGLLRQEGLSSGRRHIATLMRRMGIEALYRKPNTSRRRPGHTVYPYLLRGLEVSRPNQVWAMDITYIPMARGFVYLAAVMDWHSRKVLAWRVSVTMDTDFCVEALEESLGRHGAPEIFNTDQGSQFTSHAFTGLLKANGIQISMDGKGSSPSTSRPWRVTSSEWSGHGWTRCWSHRLPWRPLPPLHEATGAVASPLMPTRTGYGAPQRPHRPQHKPRPEQTQSLA